MPTVIHRYKISTTAQEAQRAIVSKRFAEIFATLPGVTTTYPMFVNQNAFTVCFSLDGTATNQICFFAYGTNPARPTNCGIGVCEKNYSPLYSGQNINNPHLYWLIMPDTIGDEQNVEMVFAVKDSRVIGIAQRIGGFCLFHYTEDSVKCVRQNVCYSEFGGEQWTTRINMQAYEDRNGIWLAGGTKWQIDGFAEARMISENVDNYTLPAGKVLSLSNIWLDDFGAVSGIPADDYPAILIGDGVSYSSQNCPTYKTIQIDGQKYIHFGSNSWLPYDSIVVHTETV